MLFLLLLLLLLIGLDVEVVVCGKGTSMEAGLKLSLKDSADVDWPVLRISLRRRKPEVCKHRRSDQKWFVH